MEIPSNEAMLKMLVRGRLDGIVINDAVFNAYKHGLNKKIELPAGWQNLVGTGFSVETMETHLSMSNDSAYIHLKPSIKKAISNIFSRNGFQSTYQHYKSGRHIECQNIVK